MIIGLTGAAGSGKDTAANMLAQYYGFKTFAFASNLKAMLEVIGIEEPEREFKEKTIPGYPFSYRQAAQTLGTEWGRALDPDLWVKLGMRRVEQLASQGFNVVITDCRFDNEAWALSKVGEIWKIVGRQYEIGGVANHASEQGIAPMYIDKVLYNSGSLGTLKSQVDLALLQWSQQ